MLIQLSQRAEAKLTEKIGAKPGIIRLIYDTEGCGCAVNGVPGLRIIGQPEQDDVSLEVEGSVPLVMNRMQMLFFEEEMKLDLPEGDFTFRLDSKSQTYGTNIQIVDTRN